MLVMGGFSQLPEGIGDLVGRSVPRIEDEEMLRGTATFLDDIRLPRQRYAAFVRSLEPHADIAWIDTAKALVCPGVEAVYTGADLEADGVGGIPWEVRPPGQGDAASPSEPGDPSVARPQPAMPSDRALYVGQILAMVVGSTPEAALDGAEQVVVHTRSLPAAVGVEQALAADAPVVDPQFPDNICFRVVFGDAGLTQAAFAEAAHVTRVTHVQNRGVGAPIETRSYIGAWNEEERRFTLYATAGKPHPIRNTLAKFCFRCAPDDIRVIVPRLGGGFGAKNVLHSEQVLVLWAARRLGYPVRWASSRTESFLADVHTRDMICRTEYAFDSCHRLLAMRVVNDCDLGAYFAPRAVNPVRNSVKIAPSLYDVPCGYFEARAVLTNTVPTCPIRGAGEPEGQYTPERLMDVAADELGVDRIALRRLNLITSEQLPYLTPTGLEYDCGDFAGNMERALSLSDRPGYEARCRASDRAGRLRGFSLCNTIEALGHGLDEEADIRCLPDGFVELRIGSMSNGQGHDTVYGQIIAGKLGIPIDRVRVIQGDTGEIAYGTGTGACRSIVVGGATVLRATDLAIERARLHAAAFLEAAPEDVVLRDGRFFITGTDRMVTFEDVVRRCDGISVRDRFDPDNFTYPNGTHCAEVEVDPETGFARIDRYVMVHDCGTPLNPMIVEAQLRGGVVHGLGQAFSEHVIYDGISGQILSGSFMDYGLPRADDIPETQFLCELNPVPTAVNPLGAKAVGEAGVAVAPVLAVNAVLDALRPLGVADISMPMTPFRVMEAITAKGG